MRVLVTRSEPDAGRFGEALRAKGHEPLLAPLLRHETLEPPADLDQRLEEAQAVLLTSANGARALAKATARRDLRLLVVGDATGETAEALGFHDTLSASGDVTALAVLVRKQIRPNAGPLLHVGGTATAGDLVGQLAASGYAITHVALYETRLSDTLPFDVEHALAAGTIDVVTLFSPRTAEAFVKLASRPEIAGGLAKASAVVMSQAVAERASSLPWREVAVAGRPTQDEMLLAIDRLTPPPAAAADQGEPVMSDAPAKPTPAAAEAPPPSPPPPPPEKPAEKPAKPVPTRQPRRGVGVIGAFITGIVATIVVLVGITAVYLADPETIRGAAYSLTGHSPPPRTADQIKPLQDRITALEARPAPADPAPALREAIGRVEQRVEAQERRAAAVQDLAARLDALTKRVEAIANRPPPPAPTGPSPDTVRLEGALGQMRAELAVLKSELQSAQAALKALSARPADAPAATPGAAPSADQGDAARQVAVLTERLDRLEKRDAQAAGATANLAEKAEVARQLAELEARLRGEIARGGGDAAARDAAAQARARADAVEKEVAARLEAIAKETAAKIEGLSRDLETRAGGNQRALTSSRGAAVIGVAARLRQALESGGPFTSGLELLAPLAASDPQIAAMRDELAKTAPTGVVPVRVLAGQFPTVARAVIAADLADDSFWQRVLGKLKSIVSIRRVGENTKGMEADAILARAEAAVNAGDLGRAVSEMKQLSGAAASPAATWLINAETHLAAQRVVDRLSLHGVALLSRGTAQ
ncbi:MAG: uroporphyrinogen-III synthase [Reyranellaceae bacterium]